MSLILGNFLDELLAGDLPKDTITTIYGPAGVGKTTVCFQYSSAAVAQGKKVIFVDTEGGFSVERLKQINPNVSLQDILVLSPKTFEAQQKAIDSLNKQIKSAKDIGLIVIDSLVMLYRLKLGDAPQKINKELGEQLRKLTEIARTYHIPVLVTNQMYTTFETKEKKMVGGNVLEYWSKTVIEFDKENDIRCAKLIKHKHKKEGQEFNFDINNQGVYESKSKSFKLFK